MDNEQSLNDLKVEIDEKIRDKIQNFIKFHNQNNKRVCLLTSGGTLVQLEKNTVRFVDNFSVGTRGSSSAEYFLRKSYAIIYLYRSKTLSPFERHFTQLSILDIVDANEEDNLVINGNLANSSKYRSLIDEYKAVLKNNLLLKIEFNDVYEYLNLLEFTCCQINCLNQNAIVYLAAAVSDFYLPKNEMSTHKIQSNNNGLDIHLKPVPKMLDKLSQIWCKHAFIVSFKLETDQSILINKCVQSLNRYRHNVVIGNLLNDRKTSVKVVTPNQSYDDASIKDIQLTHQQINENKEIEEYLVDYIVQLHDSYISNKQQ